MKPAKETDDTIVIAANATLRCNYSCPYCYNGASPGARDLLAHHDQGRWLEAFRRHFSSKTLNFYFSGGEPFIYRRFVDFVRVLSREPNVTYIKVDTNGSVTARNIEGLDPTKVKLMLTFHPSQVSFEDFLAQAERLQRSGHLEMVNYVAYPFDRERLRAFFTTLSERGIFANVAWNVDAYREYTPDQVRTLFDLVTDQDAVYKLRRVVTGKACFAGKNYLELANDGMVYRCLHKEPLGNLFDGSFQPLTRARPCPHRVCQCIVRYPLLAENSLPHAHHMTEYVQRNLAHRRTNGCERDLPVDSPGRAYHIPDEPVSVRIQRHLRNLYRKSRDRLGVRK